MKTPEKALYLVIIVLLITAGALGWFLRAERNAVQESANTIKSLTDTVTIFKNKDNQSVSKITQLQTANTKAFLDIKTKDEAIKRLQVAVSDNKDRLGSQGSVTVFDTNTKFTTTAKTEITGGQQEVITSNNINHPDTIKVYPEYTSKFNLDQWVRGNTVANKDSTKISLNILNKYTVVNGEEDIPHTGFLGLWKKKTPFSEVTNLNPYSETPVLRTYSVREGSKPKKLISVGPQIGISLQGKTYVGFGAHLNLFSLF